MAIKYLNAILFSILWHHSELIGAESCRQITSCSELQSFYRGSNVSGCTEVDIGDTDCRITSVADSTTQPSFKRTFKKFKAGTITFGSERFFAKPFIHPTVIEDLDINGLQVENNPFGNRGSLTLVSGKIGRLRVAYANVLPLNLGSGVIVSEAADLEKMQIVRSLRTSSQLVGVDLTESLLTLAPSSIKDSDLSGALLAEGLDFSSSSLDGTNLAGIRFWNAAVADGKSFQDFSSDINLIKWPSNLSPAALKVLAAGTSQVITQEMLQNLQNVGAAGLKNRTFDRNISFANFDVSLWNLAGSDLRRARFENAKGVLMLAKSGRLQGAKLTGARICAQDLQALYSTLKVSNQTINLFQAEPISCGSSTVTPMAVNNLSASKIGTAIGDARRLGNINELKGLVEKVWSLGLGPKVLANLQGSNHVEAFLMEFSRYWKPIDLVGARQLSDDLCVAYDNANAQERAFMLALVSWHGVGQAALADIAQALRKNPALADHGFYPADGATCASYQAKNWSSALFLRQRAILDFWRKTPQSYPELVTATLANEKIPTLGAVMVAFEKCNNGIDCSSSFQERQAFLQYDPLLEMQSYLEWVLAFTFPSEQETLQARVTAWDDFLKGINQVGFVDVMQLSTLRSLINTGKKPFIDPATAPGTLPVTTHIGRDELVGAATLSLSMNFPERRRQLSQSLATLLAEGWDKSIKQQRLPLPLLEMLHRALGLEVPFRGQIRTLVKSEATSTVMNSREVLLATSSFYNLRLKSLWLGVPGEQDRQDLTHVWDSVEAALPSASESESIFPHEWTLIHSLTDSETFAGLFDSLQPLNGGFWMPLGAGQEPLLDVQPENDSFYAIWAQDKGLDSLYNDIAEARVKLSVPLPVWMLSADTETLSTKVTSQAIAATWLGYGEVNSAHILPPVPLSKSDALRLVALFSHDLPLQRLKSKFTSRNGVAFMKLFENYASRVTYGRKVEEEAFSPDYEAVRKGNLLGQKIKYSDFFEALTQDIVSASSTR